MKVAKKTAVANAYAGLGDILAGGFDPMLTSDASDQMIDLDDIEIEEQDRGEFEDSGNTLDDLGESLLKEQLQSILVRPNTRPGAVKPFLLVAGERRVRAARLKGMKQLRGRVKPMSDEQASDAQFAENVHRKNLTQLEEAKRIQRDLDSLGSVEAVLAKHNKSHAWLSKILSLLKLPPQAQRLLRENISADLEVINTVKTIEKASPELAGKLVDELKVSRGKVNAREEVQRVKDKVKPSKKVKAAAAAAAATPRDKSHEAPGGALIVTGGRSSKSSPRPEYEDALAEAYTRVFERGESPNAVLKAFTTTERLAIEAHLSTFHKAGEQAKDVARVVFEGFRNGGFATDGLGAMALAAYLQGADRKSKFSVLNVLSCLKS